MTATDYTPGKSVLAVLGTFPFRRTGCGRWWLPAVVVRALGGRVLLSPLGKPGVVVSRPKHLVRRAT